MRISTNIRVTARSGGKIVSLPYSAASRTTERTFLFFLVFYVKQYTLAYTVKISDYRQILEVRRCRADVILSGAVRRLGGAPSSQNEQGRIHGGSNRGGGGQLFENVEESKCVTNGPTK